MIVEPTSGNTGIGLAYVAAVKGYRCILVMPESMSVERRKLLKIFGAELVLTPAAGGMAAAIAEGAGDRRPPPRTRSCRSSSRTPPTPRSTAGPRPRRSGATPTGRWTSSSPGVGTGGTITGVAEVLKRKKPGFRAIAVEPVKSPVLSGGQAGPHRIQGIGAGFVPGVFRRDLVDEILQVREEDAGATSRRLAQEEGMLVGISAGANVWAALQVAARPDSAGKTIVTVACDTGRALPQHLALRRAGGRGMKLSTRSRYGVRLMTRLALNHGKGATLMSDISRLEGISEKYLGQIIIPLRGAGLVSGRRGAGGGYTLSRTPSEITVRDVVEVLEGDISLVPCTGDPAACSRSGACAATEVWQKLAGDVGRVLDSYTLKDLADAARRKAANSTEYSI